LNQKSVHFVDSVELNDCREIKPVEPYCKMLDKISDLLVISKINNTFFQQMYIVLGTRILALPCQAKNKE
jgi:hypothetical protein